MAKVGRIGTPSEKQHVPDHVQDLRQQRVLKPIWAEFFKVIACSPMSQRQSQRGNRPCGRNYLCIRGSLEKLPLSIAKMSRRRLLRNILAVY